RVDHALVVVVDRSEVRNAQPGREVLAQRAHVEQRPLERLALDLHGGVSADVGRVTRRVRLPRAIAVLAQTDARLPPLGDAIRLESPARIQLLVRLLAVCEAVDAGAEHPRLP